MKKFIILVIFSSLLISLLVPTFIFAKGLVPCGGKGEHACTACDIFVLIQNIMNLVFEYSFVIAFVLIIIAGFNMMFSNGNSKKIQGAWNSIQNVLIGLVLILGAWVVVNTVLYFFAPGLPRLQRSWYKFECVSGTVAPSTENTSEGEGGTFIPGAGGEGGGGSGGGMD